MQAPDTSSKSQTSLALNMLSRSTFLSQCPRLSPKWNPGTEQFLSQWEWEIYFWIMSNLILCRFHAWRISASFMFCRNHSILHGRWLALSKYTSCIGKGLKYLHSASCLLELNIKCSDWCSTNGFSWGWWKNRFLISGHARSKIDESNGCHHQQLKNQSSTNK